LTIPGEFGTADLGLSWAQQDNDGNRFSAGGQYGYAGTRLLDGRGSPVIGANLFWERNKHDHSWFYFLSYSNNRAVLNNVPIPGVAYAKKGQSYVAVFGLPFAFVNWRPDLWSLSAAASPFGASAEAAYRCWGPLQSFLRAAWAPHAYQIDSNDKKRLIIDEKNLTVGMHAGLPKIGRISLAYVYGFNRHFIYGKSLTDKARESLSVGDASGIQVQVRARF
jgi:hypothetical protein